MAPVIQVIVAHPLRRVSGIQLRELTSFVLLLPCGCGAHIQSAAEGASRTAVPVVVDQSLRSFEDPRNRERLSHVLGSAEVQRAVSDSAQSAVEGAAAAAVRVTLEHQSAIAGSVDTMVASASRVAIATASREIPKSFGPVLRESVLETLESPRLDEAVARSAAGATQAALASSKDLLEQMHREEVADIFDFVAAPLRRLLIACCAGFFGLGLVTSALAAWAMHLRRKARAFIPPSTGASR